MDLLYKYYSDKLEETYFNDPTLRLTPAPLLNDPFEKIVPKELITSTQDEFCNNHNLVDDIESGTFFNALNYELNIKLCGIVSLSETPRNILMWAHYANQHKGICIGYKSIKIKPTKKEKHAIIPHTTKPLKINYDKIRFDLEIDKFNENNRMRSIIKKSLSTKSDDWMYEKEHRYIIPITECDSVKYIGKDEINEDYSYFLSKRQGKDEKNLYELNNKIDRSEAANILALDNDLIFQKEIKKSDIASIYFGYRIDQPYKLRILNVLKLDPILKNIKVYQLEAHSNNFEFTARPVDIENEQLNFFPT
ncbi:hypothetical protein CF111_20835 [Aeromonas sobria]|nr:hypothetical protein CF111_20835 [Aeromonas sobria]